MGKTTTTSMNTSTSTSAVPTNTTTQNNQNQNLRNNQVYNLRGSQFPLLQPLSTTNSSIHTTPPPQLHKSPINNQPTPPQQNQQSPLQHPPPPSPTQQQHQILQQQAIQQQFQLFQQFLLYQQQQQQQNSPSFFVPQPQQIPQQFQIRFPQLPNINISNFVSVNLDSTNYLIWKDQISSILRTTNLLGFVDGSIPPQAQFLYENNVQMVNPLYFEWSSIDGFVGSCINATVLPSIAAQLLGKIAARDKWIHLSSVFTQQFFARKSQLRTQLQSIKRGNSSIISYLQQIKSISDSLAAIGEPVLDSDLVMHTLSGLGREYHQLVITLQNKKNPIPFCELQSRLLNHEQWLKDQNELDSYSSLVADPSNSAFFVKKFSNSTHSHNGTSNSFNSKPQQPSAGHSFKKSECNPNLKQNFDSTQVPCQICYKTGHYASRCRFRYATSIKGPPPVQKAFAGIAATPPASFTSDFHPWMPEEQKTDTSLSSGHWSHTESGPVWIPDSGATSHMTNDSSLLADTEEFQGDEQVIIGDVYSQ